MNEKKIVVALAAGLGVVGGVAAFAVSRVMRKGKVTKKPEVPSHGEEAPVQESKARPIPTVQPHSRVERMFGDRETWDTPGAEKKIYINNEGTGFKGFLFIQCEACGKEKSFFFKYPVTSWTCECGHVTRLRDLLPAHTQCNKCGDRPIKYKTNSTKKNLTIACKNCQAPIDMELNGRGTAYKTLGVEFQKED